MKQHIVSIKSIIKITHDVLKIVTEKPKKYAFTPGQATEISINKSGWKNKKNPFTFTCLPEDDFLAFTIKTYPSHKGVTNELLHLKINDELILHEVFGAISYKGEGVFMAGGAGVTPFISISEFVSEQDIEEGSLYPPLKDIREVSLRIAVEVAEKAYDFGLARNERPDDLKQHIADYMYDPKY